MSLVPKDPGSGSGCQLEAVVPEQGLGDREVGLRHGRRGPNKVAASTGCCVSRSKPRNATSAKERLLNLRDQHRNWGNAGTVKVGGQGRAGAFPRPHCLGQMIFHEAGLPRARSTPGGPGEPLGQSVAPLQVVWQSPSPQPSPEGRAWLGGEPGH